MTNPLLLHHELPDFSQITADKIEPALDELLSKNRQRIADLLNSNNAVDASQLALLEQWDDEIDQFWSPISHLNGVKNSDELRDSYNACLPKLTEYGTEMGQNKAFYELYKSFSESDGFKSIGLAQKTAVNNALRDFTLSGIALNEKEQRRYGEIKQRMAELSTQFSNNVLDATHGWSKHIEDVSELSGVPASALDAYQQAAKAKGKSGYLVSLDIPAYLPLMQYCDNALLRKEMYLAYNTRASELEPNAGKWDNGPLMDEILALRHELAQLLGFNNYAERSLATKMAESPEEIEAFLIDLADKSLPVAKCDYAELEAFANSKGVSQLDVWDIPYYSEQLRLEKFALSQEELRPYFPVEKVVEGMFTVVKRLFDIDVVEVHDVEKWHPDARFYHVLSGGELVAKFYLDLFAREHKRGGAWMADCRVRRKRLDNHIQLPVAFLTCNFTPPGKDVPSLLTHNEVTTLFHEFGHGLHHMLTEIDCAAVSGINGVAWDAVELPSQFLENWCWEKEAIPLISGHYETGEALPDSMLEKMLAARNFQSGMQMMRQLEFSLFDIKLHKDYDPIDTKPVQQVLDEVRGLVLVYPIPSVNRFQNSFGHIFAGGYAAGYYSYKWAEVLSADAFSRFEEEGVFNAETGQSFKCEILQQGGSEDPMTLFYNFRGRKPSVNALLRHAGIAEEEVAV